MVKDSIPSRLRLGRGFFEDTAHTTLSRIGVVDIGSNSVRLVIFDGAARSPAYFYNEKVMCGLGENIGQTGVLNPEGKARALAAITRFQSLAHGMGARPLHAVATAALRQARDGQSFATQITEKTGLQVDVISGEKEAELAAKGVLLGNPALSGVICDIGGSSMELASVQNGQIAACLTTDLGPWRLLDFSKTIAGRRKVIEQRLSEQQAIKNCKHLVLVGGSWRAVARIDMYRRDYPLHVLHEYQMTRADLEKTIDLIKNEDPSKLRGRAGVSAARMNLVPYASEVLDGLIQTLGVEDITISGYGIREGILFEKMPQEIRQQDPLLTACRFAEEKDARLPGCGQVLFEFIKPLFSEAGPDKLRLIAAACYLHDISWRAHPDFRAEICFEVATRANLSGLRHEEHIFLGLALLYRYRKTRDNRAFKQLIDLVSPENQKSAEVLGKAMRFGAMLWMSNIEPIGRLEWSSQPRQVVLRLRPGVDHLMTEVALARFESLANALNASSTIKK